MKDGDMHREDAAILLLTLGFVIWCLLCWLTHGWDCIE